MLPPARLGLAERISRALALFPADLLFVHRDADRGPTATRREEIRRAVAATMANQMTVPVVPVRMTEAWLLIDEAAIRSAAGNPRGKWYWICRGWARSRTGPTPKMCCTPRCAKHAN
jgi:hypothetical protein